MNVNKGSAWRRRHISVNLLDGGEHDAINQAGTKNGSILQEVVREQGDFGEVPLP